MPEQGPQPPTAPSPGVPAAGGPADALDPLYRALFERSIDGVLLARPDGTILRANPAACAMLGRSEEDVRRLGREGITIPDADRARFLEERERTGAAQGDLNLRRADGTPMPVQASSGVLAGPAGEPFTYVIFRDVTAARAAERELRRREEEARARAAELEAILGSIADGVLVYDPEGRILRSNAGAEEMLGLRPDVRDLPVVERVARRYEIWSEDGRRLPPDELPAVRAARGETVRDFVIKLQAREGTPRWLRVTASPLVVGGAQRGAVISMTDFSARKQAEEGLRESEARFRAMGETLPYGVWLCNAAGGAEYVSQSFLDLLEMTDAEMRQFGWTRRLPPGDVQPMLERWLHCIATGEMWDSEHRVLGPDGRYHHILTRGLPVRDAAGNITCWVGINLDIDKRKQMEEQLREADRRKDEFLGMLSHELRNPLAPIRNSIYILRHAPSGGDQARRAHDVIERQTEHLTRLVDDLLDVTRIARGKIELRRARVDLGEVARRGADDFRSLLDGRALRLRCELPPGSMWVDADATRLAQLVGNLLHNAAKFTPNGGEVTLSVAAAGRDVELRVRDTGEGIDPGLLPLVFEPFVQGDRTLARTEGGLGLGLALVKAIAELHGGAVAARSAGRGKGAEFVVRLPRLEATGADHPGEPAPHLP